MADTENPTVTESHLKAVLVEKLEATHVDIEDMSGKLGFHNFALSHNAVAHSL